MFESWEGKQCKGAAKKTPQKDAELQQGTSGTLPEHTWYASGAHRRAISTLPNRARVVIIWVRYSRLFVEMVKVSRTAETAPFGTRGSSVDFNFNARLRKHNGGN